MPEAEQIAKPHTPLRLDDAVQVLAIAQAAGWTFAQVEALVHQLARTHQRSAQIAY